MEFCKHFKPAYPEPHKSKSSFFKRFIKGRTSWIHVFFEKSYSMKVGRVKLPKTQLYMVNEPDLVKQVMVTEAPDYPKHELIEELLKPLLGESIFTTNGAIWRRQRDMMDPAFMHTRLEKAFPLMDAAIQEMLARMDKDATGKSVMVDVEMTHVTADIIFRTILSTKISAEEAEEIFQAFNKFQAITQKIMVRRGYGLPTYFLWKKSQKEAGKIRNILAPIIKRRFDEFYSDQRKPYDDILDSFLNAKDPNNGDPFGYEELVDHVSMLFLAGHETSASALTWSLYLIANCKHSQQALWDEVSKIAPNRKLEFADIRKLEFTKNVFSEALRLYPPVGFFLRKATKEACFFSKNIKPEDMVMISPWLIHRHRKQWENPDLFIPERFDDEASKESVKNSYMPFGAGMRICIGKGFAMQEAVLTLANLVQRFEFIPDPTHIPEAAGRVTVRPENGVKLIIRKR